MLRSHELPGIGAEVAQVNWDGAKTRIDWVRVTDVNIETGVPQIEVAGGAKKGASGGGGISPTTGRSSGDWTRVECGGGQNDGRPELTAGGGLSGSDY